MYSFGIKEQIEHVNVNVLIQFPTQFRTSIESTFSKSIKNIFPLQTKFNSKSLLTSKQHYLYSMSLQLYTVLIMYLAKHILFFFIAPRGEETTRVLLPPQQNILLYCINIKFFLLNFRGLQRKIVWVSISGVWSQLGPVLNV